MSAFDPESTRPVAELDRRFYAFAIDRAIAWSLVGAVVFASYVLFLEPGQILAGIALIVGAVLVVGAAFAVAIGLRGTTPGNAAVGIRVVDDETGSVIGIGPALLRQLILGVAGLPTFGLGVATLAWTAVMDPTGRRRGWHDHVAGSAVVDVRPVPVEEPEADLGPRHVVNLTALRLVPAPRRAHVPALKRSPRPPASPPPPSPPPPPPSPPVPVSTPLLESAPPPERPAATPPRQQLGYPLVPERAVDRWRVSFDTGETFVVEGLALVGRRPEARIGEDVRHLVPLRSEDMSLSKTHAQFDVAADGVLVVMDRGSTNGSILVRHGVPRGLAAGQAATLVDGDHVRFGDREMTVA